MLLPVAFSVFATFGCLKRDIQLTNCIAETTNFDRRGRFFSLYYIIMDYVFIVDVAIKVDTVRSGMGMKQTGLFG